MESIKFRERWKDIKGYEGLYQASNLGKIRSKTCENLKPFISNSGYAVVSLKKHKVLIHRVIAETFIPNPLNKVEVNHKDGNKLNNCVDNLEWVTRSENARHAIDNGLINVSFLKSISKLGAKKAKEKCSKKVIQLKNGKVINEYESIAEAGRKNNLPHSNIHKALNHQIKTCGGYEWKYL